MKIMSDNHRFARIILSGFIVLAAVILEGYGYWLLVPAALLFLSGAFQYCPVCHTFMLRHKRIIGFHHH